MSYRMAGDMEVQTFRNNNEEPMAAQPGESRDLLRDIDRQASSSDPEVFLIYNNKWKRVFFKYLSVSLKHSILVISYCKNILSRVVLTE